MPPMRKFLLIILLLSPGLAVAAESNDGASAQQTLSGIDVLRQADFVPLSGRRVGLITNHTGIDRNGDSTLQLLAGAPDVELVALFSPEHGIEGKLDIPEIDHGEDGATGLPIYSLYGDTRSPEPWMLEDIDTLVFDIQDIGARFYTYISTMGLAMTAAAAHGKRFVVLDRPNPINGIDVGGPVADTEQLSFVAWHPLPTRHGMTVGELATMFRAELGLDLDLQVIELGHWSRADFFDATGQRWVNPSPNMRNLTQALLYPGIGLLETTNLSVGRGTDTPFEIIGAPWLDGDALARELNLLDIPGVAFISVTFTPDASNFEGERCSGINILITDRAAFDPVRTGFQVALQLRRDYPDTWDTDPYTRLLADEAILEAVRAGADIDTLVDTYQAELAAFRERRAEFLRYD